MERTSTTRAHRPHAIATKCSPRGAVRTLCPDVLSAEPFAGSALRSATTSPADTPLDMGLCHSCRRECVSSELESNDRALTGMLPGLQGNARRRG